MTFPHPSDLSAVGGAHPGVKTQAEIESSNITLGQPWTMEKEQSLADASSSIIRDAEFRMTSFVDTNTLPKYAISPDISYYGAGTLSLSREGALNFNSASNENGKSTFSVDKTKSQMYSDSTTSTFGSLDMKTVDGYMLNPFVATFPSTMFSPTKPWQKDIFAPITFSISLQSNLATPSLAATLFLLDRLFAGKGQLSENATRKQSERDMVLIMQDNQEIENQLFENNSI